MFQAVIVDDEPLILDGLLRAVDWDGFDIEIVYSSTSAVSVLDYVLTHPVDLVITDVAMPDMDGLLLTKQIKSAKPSVFVLILSAYNNFDYVRSALRYGAENYLLKPIDKDELSDSLSQIIGILNERAQMSNTYGRTVMTFRNTFTEQWLKNLITPTDVSDKAELLGINLDVSDFTVVCFSCKKADETIMSRFFDYFLRYLLGHYTSLFYFETPLRLVGIISPTSDAELSQAAFLPPILDLAAQRDMPIFASIGPKVSDYADVPMSYRKASELMYLEHTSLTCVQAATASEADLQIAQRIAALCPTESELAGKYPEIISLLQDYPADAPDARLSYADHFLKETGTLIEQMMQDYSPMVDVVIKTIHSFSDKDISLKLLANRLNVTPAYLGTVFRQQTGYYFNDYLAEARLKYAAELLVTTDMKIKDIVDKCCFASQTYFNRSFKRFFGTSPATYRREQKIDRLNKAGQP